MKKGLIAVGIASCFFLCSSGKVAHTLEQASKQASVCEVVDNGETIDKLKEDWQKFKDTVLTPLVALGISVPTLVSATVVVINSFAKKKLKEKILEVEDKLAKADEELVKVNSVLEQIAKQSEITDKIQNELSQLFASVKSNIESNKDLSKHVEYYNRICKALIEIETKIASIDPSAVKANIVKEINEIKELLKQA